MKYIFYAMFLVNIVFCNDELNSYLNNKDLQYQIIKDEKNQRVVIDLLDNENRMIVFTKDEKGDYKKIFDEKLYFCNDTAYYSYTARGVILENDKLKFLCSSTMGGGAFYLNYDFSKDNILQKITKDYANEDGVLLQSYIFTPNTNIPNLKDFENERFSDEYLNKNDKNFIQKKIFTPQTLKELLDSVQHPQANTIASTDFNIIFENEPLNTKTLQKYNDIAYYLQQANANDEAIFLLEKIIDKFPNRTVAYLNLADAYLGKNESEKAKLNYEKYIELMKQDGKESKIPQRVLEFK